MTSKAEFDAEEWSKIVQGPPTAGMIVIHAERGGTLRESISMAKAYIEARQQATAGGLVEELLNSQPQFDPTGVTSVEQLRSTGLERLRAAVAALEANATPEEVEDYKAFVTRVAEAAAKAHKEGGVLGMGGRPISDSEQQALEEIKAALNRA